MKHRAFERFDISKSGFMTKSDFGEYVRYTDMEILDEKLQDVILRKESNDKINLQIKLGMSSQLDEARNEKIKEMHIHEIASLIGRGTFYEDAKSIYELGYRSHRVTIDNY